MSELKTVSAEIETWLRVHDIHTKALGAFFSYFDAYREEVPEEFEEMYPDFKQERLTVSISILSIVLRPLVDEYVDDCIAVRIPIIYNGQEIGWYEALFHLADGEQFTDMQQYHNNEHQDDIYYAVKKYNRSTPVWEEGK